MGTSINLEDIIVPKYFLDDSGVCKLCKSFVYYNRVHTLEDCLFALANRLQDGIKE